MHTNFDGLARLRIEEHEAYARQRHLQRIASEANHRRRAARSAGRRFVVARGRVAALSAAVLVLAAALSAIIG